MHTHRVSASRCVRGSLYACILWESAHVCARDSRWRFDVSTYTYIRNRWIKILALLWLYEPYRQLLRLFRFNDRHSDSDGDSQSVVIPKPSRTVSFPLSIESPHPRSFPPTSLFLRIPAWHIGKLKPLEFATRLMKCFVIRTLPVHSTNIHVQFQSKNNGIQEKRMKQIIFVVLSLFSCRRPSIFKHSSSSIRQILLSFLFDILHFQCLIIPWHLKAWNGYFKNL